MTAGKIVGLPPGVTVEQRSIVGGMVYEFTHEHSGRIGRIAFVATRGRRQTQIAVEIGPCDPDDPQWEACFEQLTPIVRGYLAAHGTPMALPSREDVRNTARLYWRFLQVGPGPELEAFARGLSEEDYARLSQACTQALWTALPTEAIGLRLRLRHLHAVRSVGHLARPDPEDGLYLRKGTRFVLRRTVTRRKGSQRKKSSQME